LTAGDFPDTIRERFSASGNRCFKGFKDSSGTEKNPGIDGVVIGDLLADVGYPSIANGHFRRIRQVGNPFRMKIHRQTTVAGGERSGDKISQNLGFKKMVSHEQHKAIRQMAFSSHYGKTIRALPFFVADTLHSQTLRNFSAYIVFQRLAFVPGHYGKMINAGFEGGQEGSAEKWNPGHFDERFGIQVCGVTKPHAPSCGDDQSMVDLRIHLFRSSSCLCFPGLPDQPLTFPFSIVTLRTVRGAKISYFGRSGSF